MTIQICLLTKTSFAQVTAVPLWIQFFLLKIFRCLSMCFNWMLFWLESQFTYGFSLLCMFRTCRCKLLEILNERSQYLHWYGCSPVCVRKCLVKLADRGNTLAQNLHVYRSLALPTPLWWWLLFNPEAKPTLAAIKASWNGRLNELFPFNMSTGRGKWPKKENGRWKLRCWL